MVRRVFKNPGNTFRTAVSVEQLSGFFKDHRGFIFWGEKTDASLCDLNDCNKCEARAVARPILLLSSYESKKDKSLTFDLN